MERDRIDAICIAVINILEAIQSFRLLVISPKAVVANSALLKRQMYRYMQSCNVTPNVLGREREVSHSSDTGIGSRLDLGDQ